MADLRYNDLVGPFAVGALSAAASVVERNAIKDGSSNQFLNQAGLFGDVLIAAYSVANYTGNIPGGFPASKDAAAMTAGAGVGLLTKRIAEWIGGEVLELPGWGRNGALNGGNGASRMLRGSFRKPASAVETAVQPRKRQFFSVV
jgi:hypothetical protein